MLDVLHSVAPPVWADALEHSMSRFEIDTPMRRAMFLAQCAHETGGFKRFVENLNYSAERLLKVFPRSFRNMSDADRYAHQPTMIANRVYANRFGNGDEASGDGWKYRGRGCIQLTFKANYTSAGAALRLPLVTMPDYVCEPHVGAAVAGWYWRGRGCNALADAEDFVGVTRKINPALAGLEDRERWLARFKGD